MRRSKSWVSAFLSVLLLVGVSAAAWANPGTGVQTPAPWTGAELEWYTVLEEQTERGTGVPVSGNYTFTVRAEVAKLTVVNDGITELDVAVNGQRFNLNAFFRNGTGAASFDLSGLVQYGENSFTIEALGRPGAAATLTVEAPVLTARLLHMNDIHAKIDPLPKAAAYIKAAKAAGGNVFFVNAGDMFSGNPVSDLNKGIPMIEVVNAMGTDVLAVGNHEFDHGPAATQARREESAFPWLSANTEVVDSALTPIQPFEPYVIHTNELGQRIAFIGLTETPPSTGSKNVVGLRFNDPVAAAQRYIDELRDQVNLIVIVSHNGYAFDRAMAEQLTGADLILGAHTHTYLSKPVVVNNIPIMQAGSDGNYVSDMILRQAESVTLAPGAAGGAHSVRVSNLTVVDPEVGAIVDGWNAAMAPILDAVIGNTPIGLDRGSRYEMDVNIGNVMTDAMADYMDAEIALTNNGGIRADIPAGDITMKQVYTVMPFGNFIQKFELTGAQIKEIIEHSWNRDSRYQVDLQTSGLTYTIYTNGDGSINKLELKVNGQPLDLNRVYTVAMADYIGTGGGGYPVPSMAAPVDMSSEVDAIVVGEYIKQVGTLNYPASEGRIKIRPASAAPVAVSLLNFYNSSTLLADESGALVPLTNQATVLVHAEATAFQADRSTTAPKNFPMIEYPAGTPIPLVAMEQVDGGKVAALGGTLFANGYRTYIQNPQWFTNLLDLLTGGETGTVLFDEGHGQYNTAYRLSSIRDFLAPRGYQSQFTGTNTSLTAERLVGIDVLVITTPGGVGRYTAEELAVLANFVAGGGNLILASQTDYNNHSNPTELNTIAAATGTVIRFNSDEVRDDTNKDGSANYSPVTNEFSPAYPELLKER